MPTIIPQGEDLRKAVKWISEERQSGPRKKLVKLIEEANVKFDLSPADGEFLFKFFKEQKDQ
jgi:hypothetical protein